MQVLKQKRWFNNKTIQLVNDSEMLVHHRRFGRKSEQSYRLTEVHPFFERSVNSALVYALGSLLLFVLAFSAMLAAQDYHMKLASLILCVSGIVTAIIYSVSKRAHYDFFERSSGNFLFRIWQTKQGHEKNFIEDLLQRVNHNYHARFKIARLIINSQVRQKIAEQASYFLYQRGMLDFTELESLILNVEQRFNTQVDDMQVIPRGQTNVIDFAKFAKERVVEPA